MIAVQKKEKPVPVYIKSVQTSSDKAQDYYDLSGRKVTKLSKGIYIVNGKKVLVK